MIFYGNNFALPAFLLERRVSFGLYFEIGSILKVKRLFDGVEAGGGEYRNFSRNLISFLSVVSAPFYCLYSWVF